MKFQVLACLVTMVGLTTAFPTGNNGWNMNNNNNTPDNVDPQEIIEAFELTRRFLPAIKSALENADSSAVDRVHQFNLAILPTVRQILQERDTTLGNIDVEHQLQQVDNVEAVLMKTQNIMRELAELFPTPANIPEVRIPATQYVPEIVIPEIKFQ
ncbi:uncharacterized protein LOC121860465 [Homarus americanus]|uniref:uncharacterized protein LOC121860465 n=1 Tax=Homarus americanus TaxID=6706 RepID=UPI001C45AA68|nr:uncharacterized protein LOC121860465 [Homarus americanus]